MDQVKKAFQMVALRVMQPHVKQEVKQIVEITLRQFRARKQVIDVKQ